eukprot:9871867-Alexandrium_andersonii.AAC.1
MAQHAALGSFRGQFCGCAWARAAQAPNARSSYCMFPIEADCRTDGPWAYCRLHFGRRSM